MTNGFVGTVKVPDKLQLFNYSYLLQRNEAREYDYIEYCTLFYYLFGNIIPKITVNMSSPTLMQISMVYVNYTLVLMYIILWRG